MEPRRRSTRLKGYDYSQPGAYFVTIVTQDRLCLFGDVVEDRMRLSGAGEMARTVWEGLSRRFAGIGVDLFVVMPNHIHGIIVIDESTSDDAANESVGASLVGALDVADRDRATTRVAPTSDPADESVGVPLVGTHEGDHARTGDGERATTRVAPTLGDVVGAYKSITTVEYTRGVKARGWRPFRGRLWQRNYYEHVIRDEDELGRAREYIVNNPLRWALDRENPAVAGNTDRSP